MGLATLQFDEVTGLLAGAVEGIIDTRSTQQIRVEIKFKKVVKDYLVHWYGLGPPSSLFNACKAREHLRSAVVK